MIVDPSHFVDSAPAMPQEAIESIDLFPTRNSQGQIHDPVDPSAALMLDAASAQKAGLLAFRFDSGRVCVAAVFPLSDDARALLGRIVVPVKLYRASARSIAHAYRRVLGEHHDVRPSSYFGETARRLGLISSRDVDSALAEQARRGGKLGQILVQHRVLTYWGVARVVASQLNLPEVNLLAQDPEKIAHESNLSHVWALREEQFWRQARMVPIGWSGSAAVLAVEDPWQSQQAVEELERLLPSAPQVMVSGKRDIEAVLTARFHVVDMAMSRDHLATVRPEDSARKTMTRGQWVSVAVTLACVVALLVWHPSVATSVLSSLLIIMYSVTIAYRLWMIRQGTDIPDSALGSQDMVAALDDRDLPIYTILVPAREEAAVLPTLTRALNALDYPKDRLDVKLLLEADDEDTIAAAKAANLPHFIDIVIVPPSEPRTKPKACNYGLQLARGEYVTIFDAEDLPEPLQLKKAIVAFRQHDDKLACVQAKLSYFNAEQNLLTRWFTAEYASWFDLFLPALYRAKLPIPLGGTSNHFRIDRLRELGGWDPYNVTEDADLGIRLYKAGYYASVIDSNTYEEANSEFVNWVRQRSRWIKGYIQTWLVHMRHPIKLYRSMGARGFWGFQMS
ncbi:MAG: glycosyl transferase family 2, partial [Sulfobacillus thermosulfidooxidans]